MNRTSSLGKLRKSNTDRFLFGVCGGLGEYTSIPGWLWRVFFIISLFAGGLGATIYILFVIFMPLTIIE